MCCILPGIYFENDAQTLQNYDTTTGYPASAASTGEYEMETRFGFDDLLCGPRQQTTSVSDGNVQSRGYRIAGKGVSNVRSKNANFALECKHDRLELMLKFFNDNTFIPIDSIVYSDVWINSIYKFIRKSDPEFKTVMDVFNSQLCYKSIREIYEWWKLKTFLFWEQKDFRFSGREILPLDQSIEITNNFLLFQCGGTEDGVKQFLIDLLNIMDKRLNKKNTLEVVSPPSAGKNWFFDSIFIFCGCSGQVLNANKNTNFPLDQCFGKRVLIFNEPNFETSFENKLLMLFAGDPMNDQAKYQSVCEIRRTPVIVTSNVSKFPNIKVWNDRMIRYRWCTAPMLQQIKQYCHPFTFPALLEKYCIDF